MKKRASGVLCHITSLPSLFGIGDFGPGAYAFADFLTGTRQSYWQMLPLNPTNAAHSNSPFNSKSAFAGNVLLISPQLLNEEGLLGQEDLQFSDSGSPDEIDFPAVTRFKRRIFAKAYQNFQKQRAERTDYDYFCKENAAWLDDFAMFAALESKYGVKELSQWPEPVRTRNPQELRRIKETERDNIEKEKFLQYTFSKQWNALKKYCKDRGIQMIGDFPFFMDCNSADVWANPRIFKVDSNLKSYAVAGSPPDSFAENGQLFNCTVYNWEELKKTAFAWWIARIQHMLKMFDVLRIDHFRGLVAYWEVPAGEESAKDGKWQSASYYEFMNTLLRHIPSLPLFAEDLGAITAEVREAMQNYGIPGVKMILYAFTNEDRTEAFLPHNHIKNCVVYTGTHDTDTCQGWYERKDNAEDKKLFFKYIGREIKSEIHWEYVRMAMSSVARTAIIPLQDLLGLGGEARMNNPAAPERVNWVWRYRQEQLSEAVRKKLAEMTVVYGRV